MYWVGIKTTIVANHTCHDFELGTEVTLTRKSTMSSLMWRAEGLCNGYMDSWWVSEKDLALVEEDADHLELL